ncbi:ester cyclase [Caulobacter sp. UNC279MFTsu5.1]|uniref:ester cyclase n=1 Tax=Caulobacter sp. UNC279MFTsu5.1 TaxID=1502775 RepID=UPI0008EF21D0|nr:ester cyclase [Caulobacter sp. UNC279MFTsu5.1]SFJ05008.1 Predicted ester cyclase [Caulobacter sp. UNC279MFTsu5.1]
MTQDELRARRETIVREHMADEIDHAWDKVLATFPHPRYEIIATGAVHDGRPEVERYYRSSRQTFPDQRNTLLSLRHVDDGVVVEFLLEGTQLGPLGPLPPTGRPFSCQMAAFFLFEGETLVCERIYSDTLSIVRQLLGDLTAMEALGALVGAAKAPAG